MKGFARFGAVFAAVFVLTGATALAAPPAKFYNTGSSTPCGASGTESGPFGAARWRLDTPTAGFMTVDIRVHRLSPNTSYAVWVANNNCSSNPRETLTTNDRGSGSVSFSFLNASATGFFWLRPASGDNYMTQFITF